MTSSYQGIPVAKAGERFGLSQADLEELFQMREDGESSGDEFELPLTQVQFTEKGRGGALGYKAPRTPTVTKTLGSASAPTINIYGAMGGETKPPEEDVPVPEEEELIEPVGPLSSFIGAAGDPAKKVVGLTAVQQAMAAGLTPSDIQSRAKQEGLTFGEKAAYAMGVGDLRGYVGQAGDPSKQVLGLTAVEQARQSGLSDNLIKQMAQKQGVSFGEQAQRSLGVSAPAKAQSPSASNFLSSFIGSAGDPSKKVMGLEAVNKARATGLSDSQIRQMAAQQGMTFATGAQASLR
jgi:hypothetical protein